MTKIAKVLLVLATLFLVLGGALNVGWINPRGIDALYAVLPVGAVFLGLFLIVRLLERAEAGDTTEPYAGDSPSRASAGHTSSESTAHTPH